MDTVHFSRHDDTVDPSVSLIAGDNYIPIRQTDVIAVLIAWPLQCRRGMANVLE